MKGKQFGIPRLLDVPADSETATSFEGGSIAIFRLAPQDYHRFHSPLDGVVGDVHHVPGQYYTGDIFLFVRLESWLRMSKLTPWRSMSPASTS